MRDAPFLSPSLCITALSSFTQPFLSLSLSLYSLCLNSSLCSFISLHIYIRSLPIHQLISLDVFILSLAIRSCSWLTHSDLNNSLYLSREQQWGEPGDIYRGVRRKGIFILFLKVFKTIKVPAFLCIPPPWHPSIIFSLPKSSFFNPKPQIDKSKTC